MDQATFREMLASHGRWLTGRRGGVRADLGLTDLTGFDLTGADLSEAKLAGAKLSAASIRKDSAGRGFSRVWSKAISATAGPAPRMLPEGASVSRSCPAPYRP